MLSGYTTMLGLSSLIQRERSTPTMMFRLLLIDEIHLFCEAARNQKGTSKASTVDRKAPIMLTHGKQYIQELFGLGMIGGLAVLGYMFLISLGSLTQMFEYCGKTRVKRGSNIIGRSTGHELMTEVGLVLGFLVVLDPVAFNNTQQTSRRTSIRDGKACGEKWKAGDRVCHARGEIEPLYITRLVTS